MPPLTPTALRTQIAAGETAPLYALVGEDDVEKSAVAGEFADMVDEGLHAFNVDRLHGGEMKVADLVDATAALRLFQGRATVGVRVPPVSAPMPATGYGRLAKFFNESVAPNLGCQVQPPDLSVDLPGLQPLTHNLQHALRLAYFDKSKSG